MSIAKVIEVIAQSKKSFEDAIQQGIARTTDSLTDVTAAWVKDQSVVVSNGKIASYTVVLKITFVLKEKSGKSKK